MCTAVTLALPQTRSAVSPSSSSSISVLLSQAWTNATPSPLPVVDSLTAVDSRSVAYRSQFALVSIVPIVPAMLLKSFEYCVLSSVADILFLSINDSIPSPSSDTQD